MEQNFDIKKFKALKWWSPNSGLPHGATGVVCLVSGLLIVLGSMTGNYQLIESNFIYVYIVSTTMNALAALIIVKK